LHLSARVEVTSSERGNRSQVSKKEYNGELLEMLISEVWQKCGRRLSCFVRRPPIELLALPFYRLKGRVTDPRRCLGGKDEASAVGVAVATCPVRAGHLGGVVVMGRRDIGSAAVDVRFPVRVVVSLFT
jgi:uncharacterized protein YigA (DUF484 family)